MHPWIIHTVRMRIEARHHSGGACPAHPGTGQRRAVRNQAPWQKYFADNCIFFDERGRSMNKKALAAEITPLLEGSSGNITVGKAQSHIEGNVAILRYELEETEIIFGQIEKARYHETNTWMQRNANGRL
jgi:uncharacterized protein DUF4440